MPRAILKLVDMDWIECFQLHGMEVEDSWWTSNLFGLEEDQLYLHYDNGVSWIYSSEARKPAVMLKSQVQVPYDQYLSMRRLQTGCCYLLPKDQSNKIVKYLMLKAL